MCLQVIQLKSRRNLIRFARGNIHYWAASYGHDKFVAEIFNVALSTIGSNYHMQLFIFMYTLLTRPI